MNWIILNKGEKGMYILGYLHPKTGNIKYIGYTSDKEFAEKWINEDKTSTVYFFEELNPVYSEEKIDELRYKD